MLLLLLLFQAPDPNKGTEYKRGFVMRKCCMEADGRKSMFTNTKMLLTLIIAHSFVVAPVGKRGWKMFYAVLKDLVLFLNKDEHAFRKSAFFDNMSNSIRVHHAVARKASDYTKKQHVFRITTADWAEYLFQTG